MYLKKLLSLLLFLTLFLTTIQAVPSDFNNDGISDIFKRDGKSNSIWYMNADGTYRVQDIKDLHTKYKFMGIADFNGDGISDIFWKYGKKNYIWYMKSDGKHSYKNIGNLNTKYKFMGMGDFNGDGIADIFWKYGKKNYIWYMTKEGKHKYKNIGNLDTKYKFIGIGDFNADGIADIFWKYGKKNYIWYMTKDGKHKYKNIGNVSTIYSIVAIADFDGDGIADILWRKGNRTYIWYMKSNGKHRYKRINSNGSKVVGTGDYNNDGNLDILWKNEDGFVVWLLADDGRVRELSLTVSLNSHQTISATLGENKKLEFDPKTNPNIYQELILNQNVINPQQYIDLPLDEFEAHSIRDGAKITIIATNTETHKEFNIPINSYFLDAIYRGQNPYIHLKGVLPNELASYTITIKLQKKNNSSTINSESFKLTPKKEIATRITSNYTTVNFKVSVINPRYVEYVTVDINDSNRKITTLQALVNEKGEAFLSFTGTAKEYVATTRVGYKIEETLKELSKVNRFILRNKPQAPPPITDTTPPTISLNGDANVSVYLDQPYVELNATANDNIDGNVTSSIVIIGNVDTTIVGVTLLTYRVRDKHGNEANITRTVNILPIFKKTGQTKSYDQNGNEVADGTARDDGHYQKGTIPSYTRDDVNEIVTDHLTGLMWQDDEAVSSVTKRWITDTNYYTCENDKTDPSCFDTTGDTATTYCDELVMGGFEDWRLPSSEELEGIVNYGIRNPAIDITFQNIVSGGYYYYWSSTNVVNREELVWAVYFVNGYVDAYAKLSILYIRCVRDGR